MRTSIIYDDATGITCCSMCREPIRREWASLEDDHFAHVRRLSVWCSFCEITRVEERHLPCVDCPQCEVRGTA